MVGDPWFLLDKITLRFTVLLSGCADTFTIHASRTSQAAWVQRCAFVLLALSFDVHDFMLTWCSISQRRPVWNKWDLRGQGTFNTASFDRFLVPLIALARYSIWKYSEGRYIERNWMGFGAGQKLAVKAAWTPLLLSDHNHLFHYSNATTHKQSGVDH